MKSRLLTIAAAVTLLLGFGTGAYAQVTSSAAVDFMIQTYQSDGDIAAPWHTASGTNDTVGRKMDVSVEWAMDAQSLSSVNYTVTLPKGTVLMESAKDSVILKLYSGFTKTGTPQTIKVDASDVSLVQNDTASYSGSTSPSITVTSDIQFNDDKLVILEFYKGIYIGKLLSDVHSATSSTKMKFSLNISSQAGTTFSDSTFSAINDLADGVAFNSTIKGYIDSKSQPFSSADSILIVDRFGNNVPDWYTSGADSIVISVPSGAGYWSVDSVDNAMSGDTPYTDNTITHAGSSEDDSTKIVINYDATLVNTTASLTATDLVHKLSGGSATMILLGMRSPGSVTVGGAGLAFDGDASTDSTTFTFTLYGEVAANTVLNTAADNATSTTRARLSTDASKQIGSLAISSVTHNSTTYVGGRLGTSFTITLKNIFGDNFTGTPVVGTGTDPVSYKFVYLDWDNSNSKFVVDETKTGYLANGKQVTSVYSMPAASFDTTNMSTDVFASGKLVGTLGSSAITISSGNNNLPIYIGHDSYPSDTLSKGKADSIAVVFYATNDASVNDTVRIRVVPGAPVAFDTDTLKAMLALKSAVKGLPVDTILPIFALDTAYNRVQNLSLGYNTSHLDAISLPSTGDTRKVINFLIDGRDPAGYASTTVRDSIYFDYSSNTVEIATADPARKDSSFIGNTLLHANSSGDSSKINLGGTGDDAFSMRLNYTGTNRRLSAKWDPATLGSGWSFSSRTKDLTLLTLQAPSLVDSLQSLTVHTTHQAGRTDTLDMKVTLPVSIDGTANIVGPNNADSLMFLTLVNWGDKGLSEGMTAAHVEVSADSITYYDALGLMQGEGDAMDSIAFVLPITFDATSSAQKIYLRIYNVMNPTIADSANYYKVKVTTEATTVSHTKSLTIADDSLAQYVLIPPSAMQDSVRALNYKWVSSLPSGDDVDTLTVADTSWFQLVTADQYGNIISKSKGSDLVSSRKLVVTSVDSTSNGADLVVLQKYDDTVTAGSGAGMYDTLAAGVVNVDSVKSSANGYFADSLGIIPASTNGGADYTISINDTTMAGTSGTVTVYVKAGAASSIALDPDSLVTVARGANLPTITATLKDANGNAVVGGTVDFALASGDSTGSWADTNGTAVAVDTVKVSVSTDASGKAMATFTSGASGDSVAIAVSASGVSAVYFSAKTQFTGTAGVISIVSPSDSLVPSLTTAGTIKASVKDGDDVVAAWANVWRSELTLNSSNTFDMSDAVAFDSVVGVAVSNLDSTVVDLVLPDTVAVDTAVVIKYQVVIKDAVDSLTYSDTMMYVVAPKRGKRNHSTTAVNVADVMRLVYLIAIDEITPRIQDYFGLDLDQDGVFATADLQAELAIWRGTGTLLAGEAISEDATAKTALSYEATDKANANLTINLESSDNLSMAVIKVKYDNEKFVFGETQATDRISGVSVVTGNNEADGIYTIVLVNAEGGMIAKGNGAILNIAVSANGEKFDGVGEISLLEAGFDTGVAAEISREVLAPKALLPKAFALGQNYPNPFNPSTTIAYDIPDGDNVNVQLKVYNMRGQLVRTLVDEAKGEGSYQVQWDGADNYGRRVSSGVYFYRIKAGEFSKTRKMVILK